MKRLGKYLFPFLLTGLVVLCLMVLVATDTRDRLRVETAVLEKDGLGQQYFLGELRNYTDKTYTDIRLRVRLKDPANTTVKEIEVYRDSIAPYSSGKLSYPLDEQKASQVEIVELETAQELLHGYD